MSERPIVIDAAIAGVERAVVAVFADQLTECLAHVSGERWQVDTRVHDDIAAIAPGDGSQVVVASLQSELDRDDAIDAIGMRWRERIDALMPQAAAVLLVTIARRVASPLPAIAGAAVPTIERIRRLDLLAVELSHATGASVADVDRLVAHVGARALGADHRLDNPMAAELAAWVILAALVAQGALDAWAGDGASERARGYLGGGDLQRFLHWRLQRR